MTIPRIVLLLLWNAAIAATACATAGRSDDRAETGNVMELPGSPPDPTTCVDLAVPEAPWDPYTFVPHPPRVPVDCIERTCQCGRGDFGLPQDRDCPPGFSCQCCYEDADSCRCVPGANAPHFIFCCGCDSDRSDP